MRETLLDFFESMASRRGDFLIYDDGFRSSVRTYASTANAARGFAARMQNAGIVKGDKVLLWSENRPEWIGCPP